MVGGQALFKDFWQALYRDPLYFRIMTNFPLSTGPSEAPGLTVSVTDRHSLGVRIQNISDSAWNGAPVKYRIYYESMLVLQSPVSLDDLAAVNRTHKYRDFMVDATLDGIKTITDLEMFTNYSLIIVANNKEGFGPMAQFFWRTAQGGWFLSFIILFQRGSVSVKMRFSKFPAMGHEQS